MATSRGVRKYALEPVREQGAGAVNDDHRGRLAGCSGLLTTPARTPAKPRSGACRTGQDRAADPPAEPRSPGSNQAELFFSVGRRDAAVLTLGEGREGAIGLPGQLFASGAKNKPRSAQPLDRGAPPRRTAMRSSVERKALTPNDSASLDGLGPRLLSIGEHHRQIARPVEWTVTRQDLDASSPASPTSSSRPDNQSFWTRPFSLGSGAATPGHRCEYQPWLKRGG